MSSDLDPHQFALVLIITRDLNRYPRYFLCTSCCLSTNLSHTYKTVASDCLSGYLITAKEGVFLFVFFVFVFLCFFLLLLFFLNALGNA